MKQCTRFLFFISLLLWTGWLCIACHGPKEQESEMVSQTLAEREKEDTGKPIQKKKAMPAGEPVEEGVYDITEYLHTDGYTVSGMYLVDNQHLVVTLLDHEQYLRTQIYNVYTGELEEEKNWNDWYSEFSVYTTGKGNRGYAAVTEEKDRALLYWDGVWSSIEIPEEIEQVSFYGNGSMIGLSGRYLYRNGQKLCLPNKDVHYDFVKTDSDGTVLLQAYNSETEHYLYYLADSRGRIQEADIGAIWTQRYNEWYIQGTEKEYWLFHEKNQRGGIQFRLDEDNEIIWDAAGDTLLTVTIDNEVCMYSIQNGTMQHQYASGRNLYLAGLSPDGTKAVVGYQGNVYYYIDVIKGKTKEVSTSWPGWVDITNDVCTVKERLEASYPVTIYTGEDAVYPFQDFAVLPLTDTEQIMTALEKVETVLKAYPEGFLDELLSGEISKLRIYITGEIVGEPAKGTTSDPIAFAYSDYGMDTQFIVVDGREPEAIVRNMSHELMHAIETYITEKAQYGGASFWKWDTLQPYDFWYNYSYQDAEGNDYSNIRYTGYDDENEVYFVDAYSKTFAIEDRARIFEYLFAAGVEGDTWDEYAETPLMKKAEYLCEVIRLAFESVDEETVWEKALIR